MNHAQPNRPIGADRTVEDLVARLRRITADQALRRLLALVDDDRNCRDDGQFASEETSHDDGQVSGRQNGSDEEPFRPLEPPPTDDGQFAPAETGVGEDRAAVEDMLAGIFDMVEMKIVERLRQLRHESSGILDQLAAGATRRRGDHPADAEAQSTEADAVTQLKAAQERARLRRFEQLEAEIMDLKFSARVAADLWAAAIGNYHDQEQLTGKPDCFHNIGRDEVETATWVLNRVAQTAERLSERFRTAWHVTSG